MSYDYGNARVAAMRGRLLDRTDLGRLAEGSDASAFVTTLERFADWRSILHDVAAVGSDPVAAAEAAIERHRGERLGRLPRAVRRGSATTRRGAGDGARPGAGPIGAASTPRRGDGRVDRGNDRQRRPSGCRSRSVGSRGRPARRTALGVIASSGLIDRDERTTLAAALDDRSRPEAFEAAFIAACDRARDARARGRGTDSELVRWALAQERIDRAAMVDELRRNGPLAAALAERSLTLARFDELARHGRRDPLGIGMVMGYIAAVEVQAIRLRAVLARVRAAWPIGALDPYRGGSGGRRWPVLSSDHGGARGRLPTGGLRDHRCPARGTGIDGASRGRRPRRIGVLLVTADLWASVGERLRGSLEQLGDPGRCAPACGRRAGLARHAVSSSGRCSDGPSATGSSCRRGDRR